MNTQSGLKSKAPTVQSNQYQTPAPTVSAAVVSEDDELKPSQLSLGFFKPVSSLLGKIPPVSVTTGV